jgi:hypothetical protein
VTTVSRVFLCDALDPQRERERQRLVDRVVNLRVQSYADPGCADTREALEALEAAQEELRRFDAGEDVRGRGAA